MPRATRLLRRLSVRELILLVSLLALVGHVYILPLLSSRRESDARADLRRRWGPPPQVQAFEDGSEEWIYTGQGFETRIGSDTSATGASEAHNSRDWLEPRHMIFRYRFEGERFVGTKVKSLEIPRGDTGLVDLDVFDMDLVDVLDYLSESTDIDIVPVPKDLDAQISLRVIQQPWQNVLEAAAEQAGCTVRQDGYRRFLVERASKED